MILDTNVLVRLERELRRGERGAAVQFLGDQPSGHYYITPTIAGEMACGTSLAEREDWLNFLAPFEWLVIDEHATWCYGRIYRALANAGNLIGGNDLWIAAVGMAYNQPVATGNIDEFNRVDGLEVIPV